MTFKSSIPKGLYDSIVTHLNSVCLSKARTSWKHNRKKEDSITGAFFEGISVDQQFFDNNWEWQIDYNSFSSVTEEPHLGSDGIFQIEVNDNTQGVKFRKSFIFQSKKTEYVSNSSTKEQLKKIENHVQNSSLLVIYDKNDYSAIIGNDFLSNSKNWREDKNKFCDFIISKFLSCEFGIQDLYYNFEDDKIYKNGKWVEMQIDEAAKIVVKKT